MMVFSEDRGSPGENRQDGTQGRKGQDTDASGPKARKYDLEDYRFAKRVRDFVRTLPRTVTNIEDVKQLVRASGSVGANLIEANSALSKRDFIHRIKICRKESRECRYWLMLVHVVEASPGSTERDLLIRESEELTRILGAILSKLE